MIKGDHDSEVLIERLTPMMAEVLKPAKQYDSTDMPLENVSTKTLVVDTTENIKIFLQKSLKQDWGLSVKIQESTSKSYQALANLLIDSHHISETCLHHCHCCRRCTRYTKLKCVCSERGKRTGR